LLPVTITRPAPLLEGRLLRRRQRFLADVELPRGDVVVAHCVNTGAMEGLTRPGTRVWLSRATNPDRKLKFTWELAEVDGAVIGVDTSAPNRLVKELLARRALPWLGAFDEALPEQRYGERSRVDFILRKGTRRVFLEVKNCHLVYPDGRAYFPDSVSERAAGHLEELAKVVDARTRAHVLFFCQLPAVKAVRPSDVHDPVFAETARRVARAGVKFSAICMRQDEHSITIERRVPVDLKPYRTERMAAWKAANRKAA
jgi:sugar fermentation stimulation protein A